MAAHHSAPCNQAQNAPRSSVRVKYTIREKNSTMHVPMSLVRARPSIAITYVASCLSRCVLILHTYAYSVPRASSKSRLAPVHALVSQSVRSYALIVSQTKCCCLDSAGHVGQRSTVFASAAVKVCCVHVGMRAERLRMRAAQCATGGIRHAALPMQWLHMRAVPAH